MIIFFILHFGLFNFGHGLFVLQFSSLDFEEFISMIGDWDVMFMNFSGILIPIFALFLSHLFSFVFNYVGKEEYKDQKVNILFLKPYSRIVITHLTVLFGAALAETLGSPTYIIALMVVFKIFFDLLSHLFAHENLLKPKINVS
jgi:hypothetical protein